MIIKFLEWCHKKRLRLQGIHIGNQVYLDRTVFIDTAYPDLITIDDDCIITRGTVILAHDGSNLTKSPVTIHKGVFIGVNSIILPGVTIGAYSIIGAGSVVTKDVPGGCVVAGNPAKVILNG